MFNSDVQYFITKADIIKNSKVIDNRIALAYSDREIENINVVIAQAADELLSVKGIEASFVLGRKNETVFISSRSFGHINVQVLMEKLGGGGHLDIAGAQIENSSLEDAYKKVYEIIQEYLQEEE